MTDPSPRDSENLGPEENRRGHSVVLLGVVPNAIVSVRRVCLPRKLLGADE